MFICEATYLTTCNVFEIAEVEFGTTEVEHVDHLVHHERHNFVHRQSLVLTNYYLVRVWIEATGAISTSLT